MKTPEVTVIIPTYNSADYMHIAVESILAQTFQNWEVIIVDDCSSDDTFALAQSYAKGDSRIRVLQTKSQSGGAYIPRKIAIENARSEIIAPLDSDDKIEPDYLERLLAEMRKDREIDIVYPIMYRWDGTTLGEMHYHDESLYGLAIPGREMVKYTLDGWRIHCGGGLIRKNIYISAFKMMDIEKVEVKSFIDECLSRFLLFQARKVVISNTKYYYLENENSITHTIDIRAFGQLWTNELLLSFIRNNYSSDSEERILMERQNFHTYFDSIRKIRKESLKRDEQNKVEDKLKTLRHQADRNILWHHASHKYYILFLFPPKICEAALKLLD